MTSIMTVVTEDVTVENFPQAVAEGKVTFYSVRDNGSTRRIQYPIEGTKEREIADWVLDQRDEGRTMRSIADEMHMSIPSVRRIINAVLLAQEVEEYEAEDIASLLDFDADPEEGAVTHTLDSENGLRPVDAPVGPLQADGSF